MTDVLDPAAFLDSLLAESEPAPAATTTAGAKITFTIRRFVLQLLLERAVQVVPTRDVMPVLKNVQVDARPGRLRIIATDSETSIVASTELVDVTDEGVCVFPARRLLEIVRSAEDADAKIRVVGQHASITVGRTTWNLKLATGHDFPATPEISEAVFTTVERGPFAAALSAVRYAACRDAARSNLMVVEVRDGAMIAFDGARLQKAPAPALPFVAHIPIDAVDDLLKLCKGCDLAEMSIGETGHQYVFVLGADVLIVNKLMASFPDMEAQLLRPALGNSEILTVERAALVSAIKRIRITADTNTSAIALTLDNGTLTVAARDKHHDATETIDAGWNGPTRTLIVNHGYLTDMIGAATGDTLTFRLGTDTRTRKAPILLRDERDAVGVVQQMLGDWMST